MTQTQDAPPFKWAFDGHPTMEKWMRRFANQGCGLNMIEWSEFCNDMHGVITRAPAPVDHVKSPDTSPAHVKNQAEIEQVDVEKLKIEAKKFMHKWIKAGIKDEPYRVEMLIDELIRRGFRMQGDGWMPIETAPRDGTEVILWSSKNPTMEPTVARFDEGEWQSIHFLGGLYEHALWFTPSHWTPLPAAPTVDQAVSGGGE